MCASIVDDLCVEVECPFMAALRPVNFDRDLRRSAMLYGYRMVNKIVPSDPLG